MAETVANWGTALKEDGEIWVVLASDGPSGGLIADEPRRVLSDLIDPALAASLDANAVEGRFQLREVEDGWAVVATRDVEPAREAVFRDALEDVRNRLAARSPRP